MAFVKTSTTFVSFAEYDDAANADLRLLNENESLTETLIEDALVRATERIISRMSATNWWKSYYVKRDTATIYTTTADIPQLDPLKILNRENDFTDLCVYWAFSKYILPKVADFSNENNAEYVKMKYYDNQADIIFNELVADGDWYDFDNDATIQSDEKSPGIVNFKRVR